MSNMGSAAKINILFILLKENVKDLNTFHLEKYTKSLSSTKTRK